MANSEGSRVLEAAHPFHGQRLSSYSVAVDTPATYTVSIYQDPAHVEGLLQQFKGGLLVDYSQVDDSRNTDEGTSGIAGGAELTADLSLPVVGGLKAGGHLDGDNRSRLEVSMGQQVTRNFEYSSAYYLHHVRASLVDAQLLKNVTSLEQASELKPGDFVEFEAQFRPDELIAILDVVNPHFIGELTKWFRRRTYLAQLKAATTEEEARVASVSYQTVPEADSEIAKSFAEAVRVDFRSQATREYYGTIPGVPGFTAVIICDLTNFLVEDADRVLDGNFSVLGKVATPPRTDVPVLARNKLLDRIQPAAVDLASKELEKLAGQQVETMDSSGSQRLEDYLDLNFPSRIEGLSLNVLPIALYL